MTALVPASAYTINVHQNTLHSGVTAHRHVLRCPFGFLVRWPLLADMISMKESAMTMGRGSHIHKVPTAVENTLRRCFQQYKQVKIDLLEDTAMYGARFMPRPHSENTH